MKRVLSKQPSVMRSPDRDYSPKNYTEEKQRFRNSKNPHDLKKSHVMPKKGLAGERYSFKSNRVA